MRPSIFQQSSKSLLSSPQSVSTTPSIFSSTNELPKRIKKVESDRCIPVAGSDEFSSVLAAAQKKSLFCGEKKNHSPPVISKQGVIEWLCGNSSLPFEDVLKASFQTPSSATFICLNSEPSQPNSKKIEDTQEEEIVSSTRRIRRKKPQIYSSVFETQEKFITNSMQLSSPLNTSPSSIDSKQQDKKKPINIVIVDSPENLKVEQQQLQKCFKAPKILFKEDVPMSTNSITNGLQSPVTKEPSKLQGISPTNITPKSESVKKLQVRITDRQSKEPTNNGNNFSKFSVENVYEEFIKHSSPAKPSLSFSSSVSKLLGNQNQNNYHQQPNFIVESSNASQSDNISHKIPLDEAAKGNKKKEEKSEKTVNYNENDNLSDFEPRSKARTIDTCCSSSSSINYKPERTESLYKSILKNPKVAALEAIFSESKSGVDSQSPSTPKKVSFAA